jgi:hypothetical protein
VTQEAGLDEHRHVLGPLETGLGDVLGVVEADREELARLHRRDQADAGERHPVLAGLRDRADALQAVPALAEQLVPARAERRVGRGQVDDLVADDDRRPHAVSRMRGREPHACAPRAWRSAR